MKLNVIAVIPARYQASRFPGKLLEDLNGKSVIYTTYLAAKNTALFDEVLVATDDQRIFDEIANHGEKVVMTSPNHQSGSDRIAEVIQNYDVDVVFNIQGDEPFLNFEDLNQLKQIFVQDVSCQIHVATLAERLENQSDIENPNNVKVVFDENKNALYFSRAVIPFNRDTKEKVDYHKHIGVYAYRKKALIDFTKLEQGRLERIEKLEQLRFLENGYTIQIAEATGKTIGIDTPEDLIKANNIAKQLEQ